MTLKKGTQLSRLNKNYLNPSPKQKKTPPRKRGGVTTYQDNKLVTVAVVTFFNTHSFEICIR